MAKKLVKVTRLDWDEEFIYDVAIKGNGFIISEPAEVTLDGKKGKTLYGADSPLFGTTYGDQQEFAERWRCKCGALTSHQFEGQICPACGTPVKATPVDLTVTGWISLGTKKVINPYFFKYISKIIGKNDFTDMIKKVRSVDKDGNLQDVIPEDYDIKTATPFFGIGVNGFYNRFDEVLDYYETKRKKNADSIEVIRQSKHAVFTSHIPIYSTMLRPNSTTSDTFYYMPVEKIINSLFPLSQQIRNCREIDEDYILWRIQTKINKMWEQNFSLITGKTGFIRENMLGGDLNYTARNVIVPDPELKIDEVILPYPTFRELYKFKIIHYIRRFYNCDLSKAVRIFDKSILFDSSVYEIMKMILEKEGCKILLNRNPTLNYYSLLRMKVKDVTADGNNYNLKVPLAILPGLNADFDGDILNIMALVDRSFKEIFRNFDPKERMFLDRDTGNTNKIFGPGKDQINNLYAFCNIEKSDNDTQQTDTCPEFIEYCKKRHIDYNGVTMSK